MKERPILFSGSMVRAILDGRKTQTRRACKARTQAQADILHGSLVDDIIGDDDGRHERQAWEGFGCPYGKPGDRLWVRETWSHTGDGVWTIRDARSGISGGKPIYRADGDIAGAKYWPSIHMPRCFSRILLEIVSVRVERLHDISEEEAWAEGCNPGLATDNGGYFPAEEPAPEGKGSYGWDNAHDWYADLWESINGPGSWEANPWVWVVEFKRVEVPA